MGGTHVAPKGVLAACGAAAARALLALPVAREASRGPGPLWVSLACALRRAPSATPPLRRMAKRTSFKPSWEAAQASLEVEKAVAVAPKRRRERDTSTLVPLAVPADAAEAAEAAAAAMADPPPPPTVENPFSLAVMPARGVAGVGTPSRGVRGVCPPRVGPLDPPVDPNLLCSKALLLLLLLSKSPPPPPSTLPCSCAWVCSKSALSMLEMDVE